MPGSPDEETDKSSRFVEALSQASMAAGGTALGGPEGAALGAFVAPYLTPLVELAWGELRTRHEQNAVAVVARASETLQEDPGALIQRALTDPRQASLLHDALRGAASTLDAQKVDALARCLANGLEDTARIDQEALIVRALSDLEPIHVRVLARLELLPLDDGRE